MTPLSLRHLHMGCGESLQAHRATRTRNTRRTDATADGNGWPRAPKTPAAKDKPA